MQNGYNPIGTKRLNQTYELQLHYQTIIQTILIHWLKDLTLADFRHIPFYEPLKQIAPTVIQEYSMDWERTHRKIAELVGREKEAQQNFAQLERKVNYASQLLMDTSGNETIWVLRLYMDRIRVQGAKGHPLNEPHSIKLGQARAS